MAYAASVQLEQRKVIAGPDEENPRFGVQQRVITASPTKLADCFVIEPATGQDLERLVRVATLDDVDDSEIPINPLSYFSVEGETFSTSSPGFTLRIFNFPGEWGAADGTEGDDPYKSFSILLVDPDNRLLIDGFFWTKLAAGSVQYSIVNNADATIDSGSDGTTEREDDEAVLFKASTFTPIFDSPTEALDHMTSVQFSVKALANAASLSPAQFLAYAPGNPVVNTYNE